MKRQYTSESVTQGHPDKLCDQISDTVLDAIISEDSMARVACETCATTGLILVMGEISTTTYVPVADLARKVVLDIGYDDSSLGFDGNSCAVLTVINEQSQDIAAGVSRASETRDNVSAEQKTGAGDQGMMFGFACDETEEYMPLPLVLTHKMAKQMDEVRKGGKREWMRPDGKAQLTVSYDGFTPVSIDAVVLSTQHDDMVSQKEIRNAMMEDVIRPILPSKLLNSSTKYYINPSGRFVIGGPAGDSGLTGRKIIVDTYGGFAPHGGGCFSGKDPTKVDRSAAYACRHIAKNVVAAGLASRCQVAIAYAIGVAQPVSYAIETFGTGKVDEEKLANYIRDNIDLSPDGIIERLKLRRPIYRQTATYGHFGRNDLDLLWERLDLVEQLKEWSNK
ncbi:MAG: methionine adenosyltransferase [Christensenellales bacterium]|nr:methionine adenosyltransferase [Christensenellaceae bacterium]